MEENEQGGAMKLGVTPSNRTAGMLQCLRDMDTLFKEYDAHGSVLADLSANGVEQELGPVVDNMRSKLTEWTDMLKSKVENQIKLMAKNISDLKLPVYGEMGDMQVSDKDKEILSCGSLQEVSNHVSKLKGFLAAVKSCCVDIAGIKVDTACGTEALHAGRMFVYTFTIVTILRSPVWKTMTHEAAAKPDGRHFAIVRDLNFTLDKAKVDELQIPEDLAQRISQKLKLADAEGKDDLS